jgi:hypothetical protein
LILFLSNDYAIVLTGQFYENMAPERVSYDKTTEYQIKAAKKRNNHEDVSSDTNP